MPGTTTPDSIIFPVVGDQVAPLESWFAQQAASVQAAIESLRSEVALPELPFPKSSQGANMQAITATAWSDLPNLPAIDFTLERACWVTITLGAWLNAPAAEVRASARVTGATTLGETQLEVGGTTTAWGQVLYSNNTTSTRQSTSVRTVRLNAGSNTITARAYRTGSGSQYVNYSTLQVAPIRWA